MQGFQQLGKLPPKRDPRTLKFAKYLVSPLPAPPASVDLTAQITNIGTMLNDQLGDCVIAAGGHTVQAWTAEAGNQVILPDSAIEATYSAVAGYVPGDSSTDNGTVILDFLNYWRQTGVSGHKIGAYVALDPTNKVELQQAIYYFGGAFLGIELPLSAQDQAVWSVATGPDARPGTWGGHGVPLLRYSTLRPSVITWGAWLDADWDFLAKYCDEAYALISQDQLGGGGKTPEGFDMAQLQQDLQEIAR